MTTGEVVQAQGKQTAGPKDYHTACTLEAAESRMVVRVHLHTGQSTRRGKAREVRASGVVSLTGEVQVTATGAQGTVTYALDVGVKVQASHQSLDDTLKAAGLDVFAGLPHCYHQPQE